jgi:hypothetical protein
MSQNADHVQAAKVRPARTQRNTLLQLPGFYAKAIFRPSARAYAQMGEYARWSLVWLQLLVLLLIPVVLGLFRNLFRDTSTGIDTRTNTLFAAIGVILVGVSVTAFIIKVIFIPLIFFIGAGMQYLLAKLLGGRSGSQGRFVVHAFDMLLYLLPLTFISGVIITVFVYFHISTLFFAPLISSVLFLYGVFLNVFVVRGVHHLDREKALAVVLIPYIVGIVAIFVLLTVAARLLLDALH